MARSSANVIIFLEAAQAHRDLANQFQRRGIDAEDAVSGDRLSALAFEHRQQAVRLEAHAARIGGLFEQAERVTSDLKTEIEKAKQTLERDDFTVTRKGIPKNRRI